MHVNDSLWTTSTAMKLNLLLNDMIQEKSLLWSIKLNYVKICRHFQFYSMLIIPSISTTKCVASIVFGHDLTDVGILCIIFWSQVYEHKIENSLAKLH